VSFIQYQQKLLPTSGTAELVPVTRPREKTQQFNPYRSLRRYAADDEVFGRVEFWEHFPDFKIPISNLDRIHVVTSFEEHRIDLISWFEYRTTVWWWLICAAQEEPIFDPIQEIVQGKLLRVPHLPNVIGRVLR
jgi:hypothetical protein